ncbi:MAG TPA: Spy/CpxP family protein refolding chaperone [Stellaceae bacterium]|nr:Spy/CpxP family protein refolding chaperone [Stellaceae bacterium]
MSAKRILGVGMFSAALALGAPLALAQQQMTPAPAAPSAAPAPSAGSSSATAKPSSREARVEARIKSLHTQLKITPGQEQEWGAVADVMRQSASNIDELSQERSKDRTSMTAVDNLKSYQAIADAHADEMNKLVPAFQALYVKMSPDQQKNADQVFQPRARHSRTKKSG